MKVLLLSEANSIHTKRWIEALCQRNFGIMLVSLSKPRDDFYKNFGVNCLYLNETKSDSSASVSGKTHQYQYTLYRIKMKMFLAGSLCQPIQKSCEPAHCAHVEEHGSLLYRILKQV